MGLTGGERAALWRKRQREDVTKHEEYKKRERERYIKRKQQGVLKNVADMTSREQRKVRKAWKRNQRSKRKRDQTLLKAVENTLSPPVSPSHEMQAAPADVVDGRRSQGRKKVRKDRAKCYRENFKLRVELDRERRLKNKYKQRYYRAIKRSKDLTDKAKRGKISKELKLFSVIVGGIKQRYKYTKSKKERRIIRKLIYRESLLKKYGICAYATKMTGIRMRARELKANRVTKTRKIRLDLKQRVTEFYERDDNSRVKAGKKSTVTRGGMKKQIRLLNESARYLHKKFLLETKGKISYSLFSQLKPFWVMKASERDRDTCMCKWHANPRLKINRLFAEKVIKSNDFNDLLKNITCNIENQKCMYRECDGCKNKKIETENVTGKMVEWYVWKSKRVTREKTDENGEKIQSQHTMTVKEMESGTIEILVSELQTDLERLCRHVFNINHQYGSLRRLREEIKDDEVLIHIDFSENYCCKYSSEIQSTHFGASKRQISIHTGVAYTRSTTVSFATTSDCLRHGPGAIWAHLDPVLKYLNTLFPNQLKRVHFISDGPTTQYRSKTNFLLFSKKIYKYGFRDGTWNFLEAGHGKGAPDGIGAVVKRLSDDLVNTKQYDIMKASHIVTGLKELGSTVKCFEVSEEQIISQEAEIPKTIKQVPNTMKIHQVITTEESKILSRILSCCKPTCSSDRQLACICFDPVETSFEADTAEQTVSSKDREASGSIDTEADVSAAEKTNKISLKQLEDVEESLIGQYCMVLYVYDGLAYPGIVVSVDDDDLEVKTMSRIGRNRWFWPMREDILWYKRENVITMLEEEPTPVTNRHYKIDDEIWSMVEKKLP